MNWSWRFGKLEDEYVLDDYLDLYLQLTSMKESPRAGNFELELYYSRCLECLEKAFGFELTAQTNQLTAADRELFNLYGKKALALTTPTAGYQEASIFMTMHGSNLIAINKNVEQLILVYRKIMAQMLTNNFELKQRVTKKDILNAGYTTSWLPSRPNYDDY